MIEFPTSATFSAIIGEPRFFAALAVAFLSGLVRGFSGFGSALIYIPLMAAIYEPRVAAVTLLITDFVSSTPFTLVQTRNCNWREVIPVTLAAIATLPLGVMALLYFDPVVLRWCIVVIVTSLLIVLVSGWRYHTKPGLPASLGVGLVSGVCAGAVQIAGPAPIVYWLGGPNHPVVIRANLMVFFVLLGFASIVVYAYRGLFTADVLALSALFGPAYIGGIALGTWMFGGASEQTYRRIAYAIIAISAIVSLPLFDELLR